MGYIVLDKKGIGYSDNDGVHIIPSGKYLDNKLVLRGLFTTECIEKMIKTGRIKAEKEEEEKTLQSPLNKMAKTPNKKGKGDK